ncbi:MAG: UvrD-helicase domain-containing protein [Oscillospiraceae bacterium]|jgi:DNA helicase-2/ATP-dependent DNA helicase PcrA|nr:UvrD-helicase domain-containing protein [Oscillospiraceae bacterium]
MTRNEFEKSFAEARRSAIALDFAHLNAEQREAVLKTEGPLLILAGAGSGKTTVLINRIANLLAYGRGSDSDGAPDWAEESDLAALEDYIKAPTPEKRAGLRRLTAVEPCEPWRIIAITFTNKAAGEMKTRLSDMLGESARDIWAMTFHSACARILRRDIDKLGYDSSFAIYDTTDTLSLMKRIMKEAGVDDKEIPPRSATGAISRAKDAMISPEEFIEAAEKKRDVYRRTIGELYLEYQKRLRASNALDFDDLIMLAVKLLTESQETREYYQRRFKYVLVDEYQDTNNLQYRLASLLAGERANICVVGDDDQSIYKFRGATIENILGFEGSYDGATVIRLERNYRSTTHILDAANDVISRNKTRHGKKLWTDRDEGDLPKLHLADDERGEARFVAETVIDNVAQGKTWADHAVLYRMNAQSNNFEYEFKRNNIPYRVYGGTGFFDRAEVKDMMAYLCAVNNPTDEVHLLRIINNPPRGIGATTIEAAQKISLDYGISLYEAVKNNKRFPELQKAAVRLNAFVDMLEYLREMGAAMPLDEFYDLLIETSGIVRELEKKRTDENITRIENIRELKTNIVNFLRDNEAGELADFLGETALYTDLEKMNDSEDCVAIMTMHSAKGLEFDTVFVVGAEDGIFPGIRSIGEPEEMEEERRLCYVAMTRAKRRLFFVCARQRMLFGKTARNKLSRFVEEIAESHLDRPAAAVSEYLFDSPGETFGFAREHPTFAPRPSGRPKPKIAPPPTTPVIAAFAAGDTVQHKAFGRGKVLSVTPTGGDALLEVSFETSGNKRLMMKSASAYMAKI